jgi:hypothetical protein
VRREAAEVYKDLGAVRGMLEKDSTAMDPRVRIWWLFLCALAPVNVALWCLSLGRYRARLAADPSFAGRRAQVVLSLIYVVVCAFRGVLPRADVQRICIIGGTLSSVAVGRSVATLAELACVIQWALLVAEWARAVQSRLALALTPVMVALIAIAEGCSWSAVLTTNYLGNAIEESCWTAMAAVLAIALIAIRRRTTGAQRGAQLLAGVAGCVAYIAFMVDADVSMYWSRWAADTAAHKQYLPIVEGWRDLTHRWVVTGDWSAWSSEIPWMTMYFSVAVWVMVSLAHMPRIEGGPEPLRSGTRLP